MTEPRYAVDSETRVITSDQISHEERIRLEALNFLAGLYVGSSRATLTNVFQWVDEVERYIKDGIKPTF
jgi:hypothetical protein